jgi:hypothetical protein
VSFEIHPTERFWRAFRERLPIAAQERLLDLIETMRERPGEVLERGADPGVPAVLTRPVRFDTDQGRMVVRILFQYDADESSIHLYSLFIAPDDF